MTEDEMFSATIYVSDMNDRAIHLSRCMVCAAVVADNHRNLHYDFHKKLKANGS